MTDIAHLLRIREESICLKTESEMDQIISNLAIQINENLKDLNPIVLCIMTGGVVLMGKLLPKLNFPLEIDYIHASRYGKSTVGSELNWIAAPHLDLSDRNLLIVDDILDEGGTLTAIIHECKRRGAKEIYTTVLVEKLHDRKVKNLVVNFIGVKLTDYYLFGYGMDYKGYWRNAPGIYAIPETLLSTQR